jgi:hypothetical protein
MPVKKDENGRAYASGDKLLSQYWEMYIHLMNIGSTDKLPPDQLREVKLAVYSGMGFILECISSGDLRRAIEYSDADDGVSYNKKMRAMFNELTEFLDKEMPELTLKAEIYLNANRT